MANKKKAATEKPESNIYVKLKPINRSKTLSRSSEEEIINLNESKFDKLRKKLEREQKKPSKSKLRERLNSKSERNDSPTKIIDTHQNALTVSQNSNKINSKKNSANDRPNASLQADSESLTSKKNTKSTRPDSESFTFQKSAAEIYEANHKTTKNTITRAGLKKFSDTMNQSNTSLQPDSGSVTSQDTESLKSDSESLTSQDTESLQSDSGPVIYENADAWLKDSELVTYFDMEGVAESKIVKHKDLPKIKEQSKPSKDENYNQQKLASHGSPKEESKNVGTTKNKVNLDKTQKIKDNLLNSVKKNNVYKTITRSIKKITHIGKS